MSITTQLDAVNAMLFSVGQSPVDSLESGLYQADVAITTLERVGRKIQAGDWGFNRENAVPITPNTDSEIVLPANTMRADCSDSQNAFVVQRGARLYDKKNHTYKFPAAVWGPSIDVDFAWLLPWDELPEVVRQYIYICAGREFQKYTLGSDALDGFQKEDEAAALLRLTNFDSDTEDFNLFRDDVESTYITERF